MEFTARHLKLYENITLVDLQNATGSGNSLFYLVSGSRILVTLRILSIDVGASVALTIGNDFSVDNGYDTIDTFSSNSAGTTKRVYSDFNSHWKIGYTVTGGNASFKIGIAVFDNALATKIDNATIDVNLNHTQDSEGRYDSVRIGDGVDLLDINSDGSINTVIIGIATPTIANPITTLANTEYSYSFPANTKQFQMKARGSAKLQLCFTSGQSGTDYVTISPGSIHKETGITRSSLIAYFQSSKAGEVIEILSWA